MGAKPKKHITQMGSSSVAGARAPAEVSVTEAQPIKAVELEEERPAGANLEEGEIPFGGTIELEVLQAVLDGEEETEAEEMPPLQRKRRREEPPASARAAARAPVGVESYAWRTPPCPDKPGGQRIGVTPAPERVLRKEGPSGGTASREKSSTGQRTLPTALLREEDRDWHALRGIRANDSLGDLETVREYVNHMFTPRDLSSIRERRLNVERLQEEGMQHLLEV